MYNYIMKNKKRLKMALSEPVFRRVVMTEGQVTIIIGLIGLIGSVVFNVSKFAGAVSKIETSINHLNEVLKELKEEFKENREETTLKRKRLWDYNNKQDKILDNHELRIIKLENKEGKDVIGR